MLDGDYFRAALRYVERNPVRARMVRKAENYEWLNARGHCALTADTLLKAKPSWQKDLDDITDWSKWPAGPDEELALLILRCNAMMGLACSSDKFIRKIEKLACRDLHYKPQGRPKKATRT